MHQPIDIPEKTYEDKDLESRIFYRGWRDRAEGKQPAPPGPAATIPELRRLYYAGFDANA